MSWDIQDHLTNFRFQYSSRVPGGFLEGRPASWVVLGKKVRGFPKGLVILGILGDPLDLLHTWGVPGVDLACAWGVPGVCLGCALGVPGVCLGVLGACLA